MAADEDEAVTVDLNLSDRLIEATLTLAPIKGWRRMCLADVAVEAGVGLAAMYDVFPTKTALLAGLLNYVDHKVLASGPVSRDQSTHERLFEIIMRRFDVLQTRRLGFTEILRELLLDPVPLVSAAPGFVRSMSWMLEAAGLSSSGLKGNLRIKGLALVYLNAIRTWVDDESVDLARTMAAVDRNLRELEGLGRRLPGFAADWDATPPLDVPAAPGPSAEDSASAI